MGRRIIILIGGGSGSGKTTFANNIKKILESYGISTTIIGMDRFYIGLEAMKKIGLEDNFDDPRSLDWIELKQCLEKIRGGANKITVPKYNYKIHERDGYEELNIGDVVIMEGLWALLKNEILNYADLSIYLDIDPDIRFIRRVKRDLIERGRDIEEVIERFMKYVKPMHEKYVEPTKNKADILVPGGGLNEKAAEVIAYWVINKIKEINNEVQEK